MNAYINTYTPEEIETILGNHQLWLMDDTRGVRADFSHARLVDVDFSHKDLSYAKFIRANCYGAKFIGTNLQNAKMIEARLIQANLSNANLTEVDLSGSALNGSLLNRAQLKGANLTEVTLDGAQLLKVKEVYLFNLGRSFGFSWQKGSEIIVKIDYIERSLDEWLNEPRYFERLKFSDKDKNAYLMMLKLIKEI